MWVREKAAATLSLTPQQAAPPRWHLVDGMTADMIRRMDEAGVTSVVHLGNQDPMNLLQRTNVEWRNILDMMDQAYLAGYTGENITKLRPRGIRGSIEMAILHVRLSSADAAIRAEAEALVTPLAADLGTDAASVRNLARNLYEDPQVDLIWTLWYERDDESFEPGDSTSEPVRADGPGADRQAATGK
jgi:hypothetical protein